MNKSIEITRPYQIFIIGGSDSFRKMLTYHLKLNPDNTVTNFTDGFCCITEAIAIPDLVIIDDCLSDMKHDLLIKRMQTKNKQMGSIVLTSDQECSLDKKIGETPVDMFMSRDSVTKNTLWDAVAALKESKKQEQKPSKSKATGKTAYGASIIGESHEIKDVFHLIDKAVTSNINVYITGQTGTGKELVAKAIHSNSDRRTQKFVAINMAALPKDLIESELFGHEKGAFTGANYRKKGKFEEANGGTLFLDEIAELDIHLQSKLLRVLQEKEMVRIGSNDIIKSNFRLIIASHKDLADEVEKGNFREDLYYRIMGLTINLPPLKKRGNDILLLADYFLKQYAQENDCPQLSLSSGAAKKLLGHSYPGNIRELQSIIGIAAVMSDDSCVTEHDIQFRKVKISYDYIEDTSKTLKEYTRDIVKHYLKIYKNNVIETAKVLDIGKSTIYKMLKTNEI